MLATIVGLFCVPGGLPLLISHTSLSSILQKVALLPIISFLATSGIYVANDLADIKNDQANNKKRPLPSGLVSRKDGILFVVIVNIVASIFALITQNLLSLVILAPLIALGPLYSAPGIALKDKFVLKTLSISIGMILCLILGATADYQTTSFPESWSIAAYGAVMVGMMIFVTSPYNDLGDARGDKQSGRRTIPIVLGHAKTLYLISAFAAVMLVSAWYVYLIGGVGWPAAACQTAVTTLTLLIAFNTLDKKGDEGFIRKRHSRMVPLHLLVHAGIILGVLFA
jgi:4-hydroxybenzoate polyprenyltransferase